MSCLLLGSGIPEASCSCMGGRPTGWLRTKRGLGFEIPASMQQIQPVRTGLEPGTGSRQSRNGGEQGWRSGESTRLPPMWPGFDFQTRRHMLVEFVVMFLRVLRFSPLLKKPTLLNSNSIWRVSPISALR